jgi:hypothetical protein
LTIEIGLSPLQGLSSLLPSDLFIRRNDEISIPWLSPIQKKLFPIEISGRRSLLPVGDSFDDSPLHTGPYLLVLCVLAEDKTEKPGRRRGYLFVI